MPTVCTLTGKFVDGTGLARTGRVTFVPTVRGVSSADDLILSLGTVVRVLDASGSFSVDLYRTDDASWAPSGWVWTVLEDMTGATGVTYAIELESETANLADLSPVVVPDPYVSYVLQSTYDARTPAEIGAATDADLTTEETARIAADDLLRDGVEAHAATQRLMRKLTVNTEDASLVVLGDSTGNETYEWVYLLAQSLAVDFPAYTVDYRLWNDGGSSFDAAVTVQTGTGAQTLTIWNGSVAGKQSMYHKGARLTPMVVTPAPDLIVINHAHNGGVNADFFRDELITLTETITSAVDAPLLIIGQNPQQDNTSMTAKVQAAAKVAASRGYGFINVHDAFLLSATSLADLMFDNVHPNIAGQLLWHATVAPSFKLAKSLVPSQQPSSLIVGAPNLMPVPLPATVGALDDWTISAQATVTIDTEVFETDGTSVKMVGDGTGSATMYVSFEEDSLDRYRGRRITFAVRLKVTEGEPSTAGRIAINDGVGTTSSSTGGPQGTAWYWSVVSHVVDEAATRLRVYLYGVTGEVAGTAYFDRASLVLGDFPADPYMPYVATAADLTSEENARISADAAAVAAADAAYVPAKVTDAGTYGDGVTDATSHLQGLLDDAFTAGGGTVFIAPGIYAISSTITIPVGVHLAGAGQDVSKIQATGAMTAIAVSSRSTIRDFWVRGDGTAGSIGVTALPDAARWQAVRVRVGVHDEGFYLNRTYIVTIQDCLVQSCTTTGLHTGDVDVNIILIIGGEYQGCPTGVKVDAGNSVTFYGVTIEGNSLYGAHITGGTYGAKFRDCYFEANLTTHIKQTDGASVPRMIIVNGCRFTGAASGHDVHFESGVDHQIWGNVSNSATQPFQFDVDVDRLVMGPNYTLPGAEFEVSDYDGTNLLRFGDSIGDADGSSLSIISASVATVPFTVKKFAGSTANLTQWQNDAGTSIAHVDGSGRIRSTSAFESANGSAAFPSYRFTGDTSSGMLLVGAGDVALTAGGVVKVRANATGVGFNGSTPVAKAADPGTAAGTDATVINAVVTALRNLGLVT
jgi:lysophospholipase L1-like esterase